MTRLSGVDRDDAFGHAAHDGLQIRPLFGKLAEALLEPGGHRVESGCQLAQFASAGHFDGRIKLAPGDAAGKRGHFLERAHDVA